MTSILSSVYIHFWIHTEFVVYWPRPVLCSLGHAWRCSVARYVTADTVMLLIPVVLIRCLNSLRLWVYILPTYWMLSFAMLSQCFCLINTTYYIPSNKGLLWHGSLYLGIFYMFRRRIIILFVFYTNSCAMFLSHFDKSVQIVAKFWRMFSLCFVTWLSSVGSSLVFVLNVLVCDHPRAHVPASTCIPF